MKVMRLWKFFALGFAERISKNLFREANAINLHNLITFITSSALRAQRITNFTMQ